METVELYRQETAILKAENALLREDLTGEREERKHLNELILARTGFIKLDSVSIPNKEFKPIGNGVANWPSLRAKLEANSKVKEPEKNWENTVLKSAEETAKLMEEEEKKRGPS